MKIKDLKDGTHFRLLSPYGGNAILLLLAEGEWDNSGRRRAVGVRSGTIYTFSPEDDVIQLDVEVKASDTMTFGQLKPGEFFRYQGNSYVVVPKEIFGYEGACRILSSADLNPNTPVIRINGPKV